jgi:hypothetical protein
MLKRDMPLRLILLSIVLMALVANPCVAKDGHAQHGARAGNAGLSGKGSSGASGVSGTNPTRSNADVPTEAYETVAPPVVPLHGVTQQSNQKLEPIVKIVPPGNQTHAEQGGAPTPTMRNAIGQSILATKKVAGGQPHLSPLQNAGAATSPILHGAPAAALAASSGIARVNVANTANRDSVDGTTMIRPATTPPTIGGPAPLHYGINGTTVQNKH